MTDPAPEDQSHAGEEIADPDQTVDDRVELHQEERANRIIDEAEESAGAQADADSDPASS